MTWVSMTVDDQLRFNNHTVTSTAVAKANRIIGVQTLHRSHRHLSRFHPARSARVARQPSIPNIYPCNMSPDRVRFRGLLIERGMDL